MNLLFEAASIESRARALGKRHQKQHLHDDVFHPENTASNRTLRRWFAAMKSALKKLLPLAICVGGLVARPARASIIADWTFPSTGTPANPISADSSLGTTGTPTMDGTIFPINHGSEIFTTSGSSDVLQVSYVGNHSGNLNGQTITLALTASTTINFSGLTYLTSFNNASTANPVTQTWTYAITGGSSGTVGTVTLTDGNLDSQSLSPNMTLTAGQTITFTDTISGASGVNGVMDFANFDLTSSNAVPEPVTWALIGFGVMVGIGTAARRVFATAT